MNDEVVTYDEVLRWLPADIRRKLKEVDRDRELATPPEQRGWWTRAEAEADDGRFVEITSLSEAEPKFLRTGD